MADIFSDTLIALVADCDAIQGAAFTDLDGEDIAVEPRSLRDALRTCAAFGGLALKRTTAAEASSGREPVRSISVDGSEGRFMAWAVGANYQLVVTIAGNALQEPVSDAVRQAVSRLSTAI
ncbi:MAG: putative regulator of Ras-like GTPase activity (Roadblock/LC7/MglB family) [Bradymonadia bacterium]|jgi:predicted regulator of Ras-like GTPase activity (Roadblock/LC7/MglB family)